MVSLRTSVPFLSLFLASTFAAAFPQQNAVNGTTSSTTDGAAPLVPVTEESQTSLDMASTTAPVETSTYVAPAEPTTDAPVDTATYPATTPAEAATPTTYPVDTAAPTTYPDTDAPAPTSYVDTSAAAPSSYVDTSAAAPSSYVDTSAAAPATYDDTSAAAVPTAYSDSTAAFSYAPQSTGAAPAAYTSDTQFSYAPPAASTDAGSAPSEYPTTVAGATDNTASVTGAASTSYITDAPVTLTVGVATVSQNSDGDYMIGTETLAPGSSITEGTGTSATVYGVSVSSGTTEVWEKKGSTTILLTKTRYAFSPDVTSSSHKKASTSDIVVNGHTYHLNGATLGATGTGGSSLTSQTPASYSPVGPVPTDASTGAGSKSGTSLWACSGITAVIALIALL